jgi:dihydrolipoamide dehydrogenase
MLDLPKLPASLGIIGGGAIGCELASIFSNFGVKVKVFEYMPRILPMMDKDISHAIADALIQSGVELHAGVTVEKVSGVTPRQLHLSDGKAYSLELVLEAIGRRPETSAFDTLGLELDEHGFVKVDSNYQSSIPGIFAIGDVNGISQLAHSASNQAVAAVEFALLGEEAEHQPIPSCVFSAIEAASIGMTLESALEKGFEAAEYRFPMAANGMALSMDADQGFVKTVYDKKYGEILGVHLACQGASLMIHEAAAAIRGELTVRDAARMIHAHPTLNEALMESFLGASDGAIHV